MSKQRGETGAGETSSPPFSLCFSHTGPLSVCLIPSAILPQGLCMCCSRYMEPSPLCSLHDLFLCFLQISAHSALPQRSYP